MDNRSRYSQGYTNVKWTVESIFEEQPPSRLNIRTLNVFFLNHSSLRIIKSIGLMES